MFKDLKWLLAGVIMFVVLGFFVFMPSKVTAYTPDTVVPIKVAQFWSGIGLYKIELPNENVDCYIKSTGFGTSPLSCIKRQ